MGLLKPHSHTHTHTHSSWSLVLPRLTFLSILIFLCLIIVFWLWTVSLVLDWYLPVFWPSCQTNVLVAHQQQLGCLSSITEELVTTLQALQLSPSESAPLQPPVDPASQAPPPSHSTASPRVAYPEKFDGTPDKCKGFLLQCSLFVSQQPAFYPTEESRIAFLCSLLTGKALDWVTAVWNFNRPAFTSFESFLQRFRAVFELPEGGDGAGEQILTLKQGKNTAVAFALAFRTLAAKTGWPDDLLKMHFCRGLSPELQTELACRDEGKTLD